MKITKLLLGLSALAILSGCAIPGAKDNSSSTKESSKATSSEEAVYHTVMFNYKSSLTSIPSQKVKHGEPAANPNILDEYGKGLVWYYYVGIGPEGEWYDVWYFEVYPVFKDVVLLDHDPNN